MTSRKQREKRKRRTMDQNITFHVTFPVMYLLRSGLLSNSTFNHELINRWIWWWGWSPVIQSTSKAPFLNTWDSGGTFLDLNCKHHHAAVLWDDWDWTKSKPEWSCLPHRPVSSRLQHQALSSGLWASPLHIFGRTVPTAYGSLSC